MGSPDPPSFGTLSIAKKFGSMQRLFQRLSSGGHTRSHPEHGSQAPDRRWYLVLGSGRVGRRWIHAPLMVNHRGGFFFFVRATSRCRPAPVAGPACTVSIADTVPLAEVSLITDTFPPAIVIPAPVPGPAYTIPHCRYVSPRGNVTHYRYSSYCRYDLPCVPNP